MITRLRPFVLPTLAMLVVSAALASLGSWQVQRLGWKEALIARVHQRMAAMPIALPPADVIAREPDEDFEYTRVRVSGTIREAREFHVFGVLGEPKGPYGGPGWWIIVPMDLPDGRTLFVNRGFVPDPMRDPAKRPEGRLEGPLNFTGVLRGRDTANMFSASSNPATNTWAVRDAIAFGRELGLPPEKVYPVTVDMDAASTPPGGLPQPGETLVSFPNSHLGYALTWYGLMLTCVGVWAAFVWGRVRQPR